jgi:hypothetical protein
MEASGVVFLFLTKLLCGVAHVVARKKVFYVVTCDIFIGKMPVWSDLSSRAP